MGAQCLLGINGLEYPHWPIQQIADLAVALKASFVELGVGRITREGVDVVLREFEARHLTVEVNSPSEATRRSLIPVRTVIQSSLVSTICSRS